MMMYNKRDIENIVENFLARHFNFDSVYLNTESKYELEEACYGYGIEVENIVENN